MLVTSLDIPNSKSLNSFLITLTSKKHNLLLISFPSVNYKKKHYYSHSTQDLLDFQN